MLEMQFEANFLVVGSRRDFEPHMNSLRRQSFLMKK